MPLLHIGSDERWFNIINLDGQIIFIYGALPLSNSNVLYNKQVVLFFCAWETSISTQATANVFLTWATIYESFR